MTASRYLESDYAFGKGYNESWTRTEMLTDELKREIEAAVSTGATRKNACIEAMLIVQRHSGWISDEILREIAEFLEMTVDQLDSTATFYNHIYRKPVGRHVILLCDSVSCWILRFEEILQHLTKRLGIGLGETTADGRFTLLPIQCLGACDHAPALMIDDELYSDLDREKIDKILDGYV
jgi:NADH-quinone oxidoreductase subunit E